MLQILLKHYRNFCEEYGAVNVGLYLPSATWELIEELVTCFQPIAKAVVKLQRHDIILTDIYTIYNVCHLEVAEIGSLI